MTWVLRRIVTVTAAAAALSACGITPQHALVEAPATAPGASATSTAATPQPGPAVPAGWRREFYRDAELAVPTSWHDGASTGQLLTQYCAAYDNSAPPPGAVARPGVTSAVGCFAPDPALVTRTGQFVAFGASPAADGSRPKDIGDRIYLPVGSQIVAIQAPKPLRDQIAATAHVLTGTDPNGCPLDHPLVHDLAWRPSSPGLSTPTDITSISACKYATGQKSNAGLLSSTRLDALPATKVVAAVLGAPPAGGQDQAEGCLDSYGDEAILASVHHRDGPDTSFVLRYAGCEHNGVDDGTLVRALTRSVVAPLTAGPNTLTHWTGGGPSKAAAMGVPYTAEDYQHDRAKYGHVLGRTPPP